MIFSTHVRDPSPSLLPERPNAHAMKLIFLDIDGVLNDRAFHEDAQSNTIKPECVAHFNRLIHETGASVILTSAWRCLTLDGGPDYPTL